MILQIYELVVSYLQSKEWLPLILLWEWITSFFLPPQWELTTIGIIQRVPTDNFVAWTMISVFGAIHIGGLLGYLAFCTQIYTFRLFKAVRLIVKTSYWRWSFVAGIITAIIFVQSCYNFGCEISSPMNMLAHGNTLVLQQSPICIHNGALCEHDLQFKYNLTMDETMVKLFDFNRTMELVSMYKGHILISQQYTSFMPYHTWLKHEVFGVNSLLGNYSAYLFTHDDDEHGVYDRQTVLSRLETEPFDLRPWPVRILPQLVVYHYLLHFIWTIVWLSCHTLLIHYITKYIYNKAEEWFVAEHRPVVVNQVNAAALIAPQPAMNPNVGA